MVRKVGYSPTPLPRKLGVRAGDRIAAPGAPDHLDRLLADRPDDVVVLPAVEDGVAMVLLFVTERARLEAGLMDAARAVFPDGAIWVAWPKRASRASTDVTEDVVREVALPKGLVDNKVCAIDEVWSGLRLVWRRDRRG